MILVSLDVFLGPESARDSRRGTYEGPATLTGFQHARILHPQTARRNGLVRPTSLKRKNPIRLQYCCSDDNVQ